VGLARRHGKNENCGKQVKQGGNKKGNLEIEMQEFESDENKKASKSGGDISDSVKLTEASAGLAFEGKFHYNACVQRHEKVLAEAEDKKPCKHPVKTDREKSHQDEPQGAGGRSDHRQAAAADKVKSRGNENNEKSRQFPGEFHESPLKAVQAECIIEKIVENRIDDAFRESDHGDAGYKKKNVLVDN
jgi:hypothetical protein